MWSVVSDGDEVFDAVSVLWVFSGVAEVVECFFYVGVSGGCYGEGYGAAVVGAVGVAFGLFFYVCGVGEGSVLGGPVV